MRLHLRVDRDEVNLNRKEKEKEKAGERGGKFDSHLATGHPADSVYGQRKPPRVV